MQVVGLFFYNLYLALHFWRQDTSYHFSSSSRPFYNPHALKYFSNHRSSCFPTSSTLVPSISHFFPLCSIFSTDFAVKLRTFSPRSKMKVRKISLHAVKFVIDEPEVTVIYQTNSSAGDCHLCTAMKKILVEINCEVTTAVTQRPITENTDFYRQEI